LTFLELDRRDGKAVFAIFVDASSSEAGRLQNRAVCATGTVELRGETPGLSVAGVRQILVFEHVPVVVQSIPPLGTLPGYGQVINPRPVREVRPSYDRSTAKEGTVVLECVVQADGKIGDVRIVKSLDAESGLDEAAVLAAKEWEFQPASRGGTPIPMLVTIELFFSRRLPHH